MKNKWTPEEEAIAREKLEKLVTLLRDGITTPEEYKKSILSQLDLPDMELGGMLYSESSEKDKLFKAIRDDIRKGVLV